VTRWLLPLVTTVTLLLLHAPLAAQQVVNVYSARHYDSDEAIFERFTAETGIRVNLLQADSDALIARMQREGRRSPADLLITVDAGRLYHAEGLNLFQPTTSDVLSKRIPENFRHPGGLWFGLTKRARVILRSTDRVPADSIQRYEQLADPAWRNAVLIRSSSNVYNQSLVASMIEHLGESSALSWCQGLMANTAQRPQGGDRDQIRAVAAGVGRVAVANHYYYAQMLASNDPVEREAALKVTLVFPNQDDRGTHVNISGAGVTRNAPNRANALKLLEFLVSDEAQEAFAGGSFEYPIVKGIPLSPILEQFGSFKEDSLGVHLLGKNNPEAVRIMDRAGWR
jgi:iron(III) transport system substrate-binding protein